MRNENRTLVTLNRTLTALDSNGKVHAIKSFTGRLITSDRETVVYKINYIHNDGKSIALAQPIELEFLRNAIVAKQEFQNPADQKIVEAMAAVAFYE